MLGGSGEGDYAEFSTRLDEQLACLDAGGVEYRHPATVADVTGHSGLSELENSASSTWRKSPPTSQTEPPSGQPLTAPADMPVTR